MRNIKNVISQSELILSQTICKGYALANELVDSTTILQSAGKNIYGQVKNAAIDYVFLQSKFVCEKKNNHARNYDFLEIQLSTNLIATISHVANGQKNPKSAIFREEYAHSLNYSLFDFDEIDLTKCGVYAVIMHYGLRTVEDIVVSFPKSPINPISLKVIRENDNFIVEEFVNQEKENAYNFVMKEVSN